MNAARPSDGLLPAESTIAMVELLARRPDGTSIEHLLKDLAATNSISWSRGRNTVAKLISYGLFETDAKSAVRLAPEERMDMPRWIAERIVAEFTALLTTTEAWSCVGRDPLTGDLTIDAMTLPPIRDGLAMWLTDFAIARRETVQTRFWTVSSDHNGAFLTGARDANKRAPRRAKSAERLAADLARQAEVGAAAELWVVQYERERLSAHPLRDQIRRVSEDDVSAGYDIVSFASVHSIRHDRFIEVKSHGKRKVFHWSRNEIATAVEFGEDYALYLVDRDRCEQAGYSPHMITGPTPDMFALPESGWRVEATSFEHVAISD
jgi:hypothetical protein